MKKQNIKNKLDFNKKTAIELNNNQLIQINGGTTIVGGETCSGCCCNPVLDKILKTTFASL